MAGPRKCCASKASLNLRKHCNRSLVHTGVWRRFSHRPRTLKIAERRGNSWKRALLFSAPNSGMHQTLVLTRSEISLQPKEVHKRVTVSEGRSLQAYGHHWEKLRKIAWTLAEPLKASIAGLCPLHGDPLQPPQISGTLILNIVQPTFPRAKLRRQIFMTGRNSGRRIGRRIGRNFGRNCLGIFVLHVLFRTTHQNFSPKSSQSITPCLVTAPVAEISKFHLREFLVLRAPKTLFVQNCLVVNNDSTLASTMCQSMKSRTRRVSNVINTVGPSRTRPLQSSQIGRTPRGSCNRTLLRRVLRRFSNSKCFLEGFLEGAL